MSDFPAAEFLGLQISDGKGVSAPLRPRAFSPIWPLLTIPGSLEVPWERPIPLYTPVSNNPRRQGRGPAHYPRYRAVAWCYTCPGPDVHGKRYRARARPGRRTQGHRGQYPHAHLGNTDLPHGDQAILTCLANPASLARLVSLIRLVWPVRLVSPVTGPGQALIRPD